MTHLELLAPAKDLNIGIAAIDCGADAVYIAGPSFGARQSAGNSVEDIRSLCSYAHRFGAKIYVTVNTILFDEEVEEAHSLALALQEAGADALIVQDFSLLSLIGNGLSIPLHASTQCSIQDTAKAKLLEHAGFSRLVLERELPLSMVRDIASAVDCEIECFVHGALCVCYSGQCYLSEMLSGRSANRGSCIQACRSRYDLVDSRGQLLRYPDGRPVAAGKTLLSLKDLNLSERIEDLAEAGVCSFKIEGRLKNISYVRNTVSAYSRAINNLILKYPEKYDRLSFGRCEYGFTPNLDKTFNRSYTTLFIDGKRGKWANLDAGKSIGEAIGIVEDISRKGTVYSVILRPLKGSRDIPQLHNGDGFFFIGSNGEDCGFRADTCEVSGSNFSNGRDSNSIGHSSSNRRDNNNRHSNGRDNSRGQYNNGDKVCRYRISCSSNDALKMLCKGTAVYRNLDTSFEKEVSKSASRSIGVGIKLCFSTSAQETKASPISGAQLSNECTATQNILLKAEAKSEDGRKICFTEAICAEPASNIERMESMLHTQMSKSSGIYRFHLEELRCEGCRLPLMSASEINEIRRTAAAQIDAVPFNANKLLNKAGSAITGTAVGDIPKTISYKYDVANRTAEKFWKALGAEEVEPSYEQTHRKDAELMRSKYCIKYELGICPKLCMKGSCGNAANGKANTVAGSDSAGASTDRRHTEAPFMHDRLFLKNNGRMLELRFDCAKCEMTVHNA